MAVRGSLNYLAHFTKTGSLHWMIFSWNLIWGKLDEAALILRLFCTNWSLRIIWDGMISIGAKAVSLVQWIVLQLSEVVEQQFLR